MADVIQVRRDTAANWTSADPVLAQGELAWETDTSKVKIGDGSTAWTSLSYFGGEVASVFGRTGPVTATASDYNASQIDNDSGVSGAFVADALDALDSGKATTSHNHNASDINAGTLADAHVAPSNVTQHQAAVNINASQVTAGLLLHERGGLEADASAFDGLLKITGGATSAVAVTSAGEALLDDADAAAQRTTLGLVVGTDVQAYDTELAALAGLTSAANKVPYFTGSETAGLLGFKDEDDLASDADDAVPSQQSVKAYVDTQLAGAGGAGEFPRGCFLSNAADADHDITVTAGYRYNGSTGLTLAADTTKRIDASWAAGDGAGGLSSSLTLSADTTYHVHLIVVSGSVDWGFDTSITAANLIADHSATAYRLTGSVITDSSSNILPFTHVGDIFLLSDPVQDASQANPGTSAVLRALTVPTGRQVSPLAVFTALDVSPSGASNHMVSSPSQNDVSPGPGHNIEIRSSGDQAGQTSTLGLLTDASGQLRTRASTSNSHVVHRIATSGWRDPLYAGVSS